MNDLINKQSEVEILKIVEDNQKKNSKNKKIIEQILLQERGYIIEIKKNEAVVLLISGGLDSVITLSYIIEKFNLNVYPLFIRRGARAEEKELESTKYYINFYKSKYGDKVKDLFILNDEDIPAKQLKNDFPKERMRAIGHPLRNSTLQNYAIMYAIYVNSKYNENIKTILTGSVGDDTTCPELSILSLRSQTLNVCINLGDWNWQITSPLIDLELTDNIIFKKDLILWAKEKKIPLNKTRTCVAYTDIACGVCSECKRRLKIFRNLGLKDEVEYLIQENF